MDTRQTGCASEGFILLGLLGLVIVAAIVSVIASNKINRIYDFQRI